MSSRQSVSLSSDDVVTYVASGTKRRNGFDTAAREPRSRGWTAGRLAGDAFAGRWRWPAPLAGDKWTFVKCPRGSTRPNTSLLTSILIGDSNCALAVPVDAVHEIGGALKRFQGAVSNSVGNFLYDCSFGSSFRYLSIS